MLLKNKQNFSRRRGGKKKGTLSNKAFNFTVFPYTGPYPSSTRQDFQLALARYKFHRMLSNVKIHTPN